MSKHHHVSQSADVPLPQSYVDDLHAGIQDTLLALAGLNQAYQKRLAAIDRWSGLEDQKKQLRADLESLHERDRKPLVLRLADLHYRLTRMSLFRTLH